MAVLPTDQAITPPVDDRLGVLTATAPVVREGTAVTLDVTAAEAVAARWARSPWPTETAFDTLHWHDETWRMANWILLLDALNFSFWGEPGEPRWRVEFEGKIYDGYAALAAALTRATRAGVPLWDARFLATLDATTLAEVLRPVPGSPPIPLFDERLAHAREVGTVLLARYGGEFSRAIDAVEGDAVSLALLLARDFPSFADVASWRGEPVPFLKRAQICVADLHAFARGAAWGDLRRLGQLTAFADYKLPQLLRAEGVLTYMPELALWVDAQARLPPGSAEEVEIRAATIWAVEVLRRALSTTGIDQTASAIDYRIWSESQTASTHTRPYHRTRTIYY